MRQDREKTGGSAEWRFRNGFSVSLMCILDTETSILGLSIFLRKRHS